MEKSTRLGIIGGTFDPIHFGHLLAAECAREAFELQRVIFMPSARPPHKDLDKVLDSEYRFHMVEAAIKDHPAFEVSSLELERKGLSYTVDTLDYYLSELPGTKIFFIIGVDALRIINTWKDVDRVVGLCEFIVVTRPGYSLEPAESCYQDLPLVLWEHAHYLEIPGINISSTEIRQRVGDGKSIRYLLPDAVATYIRENHLYREAQA